jgi:hypothetical protein
MTSSPVNLVVATPCYGGMVTQRFMQSICELLLAATKEGVTVSVELLANDSLITRARNTLVATALDKPEVTHLMFIDADVGFMPEQVGRMIHFDRDVVAGMYPLKIAHDDAAVTDRVARGEPLASARLRYVGAPLPDEVREQSDGFVTAEFVGAGFLLIKRAVLERMQAAYPETRYHAVHDRAVPQRSPNQYALFDCIIDPVEGVYLSEDYAFCRRWRALGGEIWLDTRSRLSHIGPHEFAGDAALRYGI